LKNIAASHGNAFAVAVQVILGAQGYWDDGGSEYGGYNVSATNSVISTAPTDRVCILLTWHF